MSVDLEKYVESAFLFTPDAQYTRQAIDYYCTRYNASSVAKTFVESSNLIPDHYRHWENIGYCDRTLGRFIPRKRSFEGGAFRGALIRCGILLPSGHERFRGCVLFPSKDCDGRYYEIVGYRMSERLNRWPSAVVWWVRPEADEYIQNGLSAIRAVIRE